MQYNINFHLTLYIFKCVQLSHMFEMTTLWLYCTRLSSNECVPCPFLCQQLCLWTILAAVLFVICGMYNPQEAIKVFQVRWLSWPHHWSTTSYPPSLISFVQVYTISLPQLRGTQTCHIHICSLVAWGTSSNRAAKGKLGLWVPLNLCFPWFYAQFYWSCQNLQKNSYISQEYMFILSTQCPNYVFKQSINSSVLSSCNWISGKQKIDFQL
jgi:hypothetical protein